MHETSSLARWLALVLALVVICNGAGVYLKRTGLANPEAYAAYWAYHCTDMDKVPPERREPRPCSSYTTPEAIASVGAQPPEFLESTYRHIFEVSWGERWLKLAKDFFWMALIGVSLAMIATGRAGLPALAQAWPVYLLSGYALASFMASFALNGGLVAAAGLRSFAFLFAALLAGWLVPHIGMFAAAVGALLLFQAALLPFEMVRGIHLFHEWSPWSFASRVVGTLVQPNSMGVFAVAGMAFHYSFARSSSRLLWPLCALALALVLLSGSGTGLVCTAAAVGVALHRRMPAGRLWPAAAAGLAIAVLAVMSLPTLTGRADIFASLGTGGRVEKLQSALMDRPALEVIVGSGLGVDTNLALNLAGVTVSGGFSGGNAPRALATDSALTSLVIQIGLVGTLLFYAALFWAGRRDRAARPFYCVMALCTLTINVGELFPVNVLLGMAWAHSAWQSRHVPAATTAAHG